VEEEGEVVTGTGAAIARLSQGWILKRAFSTSGRGRVRGDVEARSRAWVERALREDGALRAEPWRSRVLDFSLHFDASEAGLRFVGCTRFQTDARGAFIGTTPGRWTARLPPELARFVNGERGERRLHRLAQAVAEALHAPCRLAAYEGPVGVDAMVVQTPRGLRFEPLLEVNPRWTMGRLSLNLGRRVHGRSRAEWEFRSVASLQKSRINPVQWARGDGVGIELADGLLRSGVLPTTDPEGASAMVTRLRVGRD
jgi:hypothetical protein